MSWPRGAIARRPMPDLVPPAHLSIPPRQGSYGEGAAHLMEIAGRPLDEEQKLAVDAILSYKPGGKWAALESAIIEARQNGKTGGVLLPVVLWEIGRASCRERV